MTFELRLTDTTGSLFVNGSATPDANFNNLDLTNGGTIPPRSFGRIRLGQISGSTHPIAAPIGPTIPFVLWDDITVSVVPALPGDFNNDEKVDAADYVTWRKNNGTNNALPNDNGLGTPITSAHYDLWVKNFGNMSMPGAGSGSGSSAGAVPEPSALFLIALGAAFVQCGRKGRPE
ncbi:MAG: PEP-CTERM sorting domain-containing protein [Planctomycetes bacterium]|nr:PEP-CTERM sorting domain-containing protein [Planctomycetota bacterium]